MCCRLALRDTKDVRIEVEKHLLGMQTHSCSFDLGINEPLIFITVFTYSYMLVHIVVIRWAVTQTLTFFDNS